MAKTTTPPDPAPPALPDEAAISAMIEKAVEARMAGLPAMIQEALNGIVERERGRFKDWARREIALNASGATAGEREKMNS